MQVVSCVASNAGAVNSAMSCFFSLGAKLEMRPHARLILQCNLRHAVRYVLQVRLVFEL
jgi:hypothetical protein